MSEGKNWVETLDNLETNLHRAQDNLDWARGEEEAARKAERLIAQDDPDHAVYLELMEINKQQ